MGDMNWGMADRLLSKENELTGTVMRYDYDRFDFLIRQEHHKGLRYGRDIPRAGLCGRPLRHAGEEATAGTVPEEGCWRMRNASTTMMTRGTLSSASSRQPREDAVRHDRRLMERELGIRPSVTDMGWIYEWTSGEYVEKGGTFGTEGLWSSVTMRWEGVHPSGISERLHAGYGTAIYRCTNGLPPLRTMTDGRKPPAA